MADTETLKPEYSPAIAAAARRWLIRGYTIPQLPILMDVTLDQIDEWAVTHKEMWAALLVTELEAAPYWTAKRNAAAKQRRARASATPSTRLANSMRTRMWGAMKRERGGRKTSSLSFLGYAMADLAVHLEKQFQPGMTWANYGKWHVDHIKPCAAFDLTVPEQFAACWALNNLQPMWARDNIKKGAKH